MKIVTVRKDHHCSSRKNDGLLCGRIIKKGEKAKVLTRKRLRVDGSGTYFETDYYHQNCKVERFEA